MPYLHLPFNPPQASGNFLSRAIYGVVGAGNFADAKWGAGSASEYSVAELLRVELSGDSIRFIGTDGTLVAEVYKYDYVQLTIADNPTAVEPTGVEPQQMKARKVIRDGQVYILFGDKLYNISGNKIK